MKRDGKKAFQAGKPAGSTQIRTHLTVAGRRFRRRDHNEVSDSGT